MSEINYSNTIRLLCDKFMTISMHQMMEAALVHLLEGRHVVDADNSCSPDETSEIKDKLWNQLQVLLKGMLAISRSGNANKSRATGQVGKLKKMYRIALRPASLQELHAMHKLWVS